MSTSLLNPENKEKKENFTLERVAELSQILASKVEGAINEIDRLNGQTHMIAINARIEASRAGMAGKAFSVVAEQMNDLSGKIGVVSQKMRNESRDAMNELGSLIKIQATNVRGTRLSDLALTNIDLIDRNLYERTADVRWWATGESVTIALSKNSTEEYEKASKRFGIILNSYTVYFDLVLCDIDGKIVANGRPDQFHSVGTNVANTEWFSSALKTKSGKEFGFQTVNRCPLINNEYALVYSCGVHENGNLDGKIIGVLGVIFRWEGLAQKIMKEVPLAEEEKAKTRVCIVDNNGLVLADSKGLILDDTINFLDKTELFQQKKGFTIIEYNGEKCCIAHALSPGFENYSTGWHSIIIQKL